MQKMQHQIANLMEHFKLNQSRTINNPSSNDDGFTLTELTIAAFLGVFIVATAGAIIVNNLKFNARTEALQRLRQDWKRATALIESEIALSKSTQSSNLVLSAEELRDCPLLKTNNQLRLRVRLPGNVPNIIYGVESIRNLPADQLDQWIGGENGGVLIRCGPQLTITATGSGDYLETLPYQQSIILDDLDLTTSTGLNATGDGKMINFEIVMQGNNLGKLSTSKSPYKLGSGAFSRISEVPTTPELQSICSVICKKTNTPCSNVQNSDTITLLTSSPKKYIVPSSTTPKAKTTTICTNRAVKNGDSITGGDANYVIDASPTPTQAVDGGVTINGGDSGRNILLGTESADTINGGAFDDVVVGRGGGDVLNGDAGNDNFLPWGSINTKSKSSSNVTINGGLGLDRVYFNGRSNSFAFSNTCKSSQCTVTSSQGGRAVLRSVEVLVFEDTAQRLN